MWLSAVDSWAHTSDAAWEATKAELWERNLLTSSSGGKRDSLVAGRGAAERRAAEKRLVKSPMSSVCVNIVHLR